MPAERHSASSPAWNCAGEFRRQTLPCGPKPHAGPVYGGIRPTHPNASVLMAKQEDHGRPPARAGVAHRHGRLGRGSHALELRARIRMSPRFSERSIKEIIHEIEMAARREEQTTGPTGSPGNPGGDEEELGGAGLKAVGRPEEGRPAQLGTAGYRRPFRTKPTCTRTPLVH